jgi:hypothetical protein
MQNPGCAIEFTPAKCVAFGSRDIDNLPIWEAVSAYLAMIDCAGFHMACKRNADTACRQGAGDQSERQWMNLETLHLCL